MKNRIRFLSLMLLVILFAVPCSVACAEQKTMMESKSEDDLMVFGLCTVKDTSYILYGSYDPSQPMRILSWTESQTEPELWAEGLIGCKSISSLEQMAAESKPAEIIKSIIGIDIPDDIIAKVIEAVKGLLAGGALDAAKDAISGIADTATDAAGAVADKAEEAAEEGGGILSGAINAIKKLF